MAAAAGWLLAAGLAAGVMRVAAAPLPAPDVGGVLPPPDGAGVTGLP
ncbi:hypothetical protein [Cryptosporangium japonicum]